MRRLLRWIKGELKTAKHCAIYQEELKRVWPDKWDRREARMARFAEDHGFRLRLIVTVCARFSIERQRERES